MEQIRLLTKVFCIILVLMFASMLLLASPATSQTKTLRIGSIQSLTGWHSPFGLLEQPDLENMAKMMNERGGITIKGQKYNFEIFAEDTKSSLEGTSVGTKKLVYDKQVKFILGPGGYFAPAVTAVVTPNKVLHISQWSTMQPGSLDASTPYTFLGHNSAIGIHIAGLKAMKKEFPNVKKIAIVTPDDGSQPYLIPALKRVMDRNGITMVGDEVAYPNEMMDFSPIAAKLNAIKDADAILHQHGVPQQPGNIIKGLRELGNTKPYIVVILASGNDILSIAGEEAATNVLTVNVFPHVPGNPPLLDEVFDRRADKAKKAPLFAISASSLWMLMNVMKMADSIDPEVIKAKWESLDKIDTLYGTGIVSGDETYGIKHHAIGTPFAYENIMNGKVTFGGWVDVGAIP